MRITCKIAILFKSHKNILTNNSVNFLDLKIFLNKKHSYIDIYDKCEDFDFKINKFKIFKSCMHLSVNKNILLNHLFRIKNISSTK